MADGKEETVNTPTDGNWWGSWISSAKNKSASVLEAVKRDLEEISTAVRTEVTNAGSAIGDTLRLDEPESTANTVKKSLSSFFGQVSEALAPTLEEEDDAEAILITKDGSVTLTGFQKHLAELQSNDASYLTAPDSSLTENYQRWLEIVDQQQFTQNQLAKHLSSSDILNEKYLALVPDQVSHMEFWKRYLFRRALLEDALANAEIAERRARNEVRSTQTASPKNAAAIIQTEQPKKTAVNEGKGIAETSKTVVDETPIDVAETPADYQIDEMDIKWDEGGFGGDEISEEEQARLLREYDEEIQEREKRKSQIVPLEQRLHGKEPASKATSANQKTQQKSAQTPKDTKKNPTTQKQTATGSNKKQASKSNQSENIKSKGKNAKSPTTNETLKIQKDHFNKEPEVKSLAEDLKNEIDAASDESWEKDFDLN